MPSFQAICTAIHDTLEPLLVVPVGSFVRVFNYDELEEGMQNWPALEIYVEDWETSADSETDRYTFCPPGAEGPRRWTVILIHMDLYARHRSQLGEDWGDALVLANNVQDALEAQCSCPAFALVGIRNIKWTARRVVFDRAQTLYAGYRFLLTVGVF